MLKKRLLSFFIALTLVLTSVLPSATFASNVDAENEVVENLEEGVDEEQVSEDSDKVLCVSCESENVNFVIPLLNLYVCEDCGKYFAYEGATNKKGIDEQINAVEENAKKNIEAGMFGQSDGNTVVWHFVFGTDLGNVSQGLPGTTWPDYKDIDWGSIDTDIEGIEHYDFLGWSKTLGGAMKTDGSGVNYNVGQTYGSGRAAFSVFAKHKYTMSVEGNGDTKVTYGENFVLPTDFTLEEGQEFKGWKDADDVEYAAGDTIENVDRDMEFFAIVEACEYSVKVGDEDATKIVYGDTITLPEEYDDIEGKTFTGWKDQQGNVYDKGEEVVIKGNKNFTPVYEDVYYDVYVNGEKKASVKHGDKFTLPNDFEVGETEVFTGWEDEDSNAYEKGAKVTIVNEMIFTPVIGLKELRTVTFDSDGGSEVEAQEVYDGLKVTKPEDPEKEHYNFAKWTLDGSEYNFDTKVTSDITLKAIWEAKKYTINVDGDEQEVAYGDKITLPTTKESSDNTKVFDDFVDEDGNHYAGGEDVTVDGPKTFTPTFKEKEKFAVRYFDGTLELTDLYEEVYEGFTATDKVVDDKEHYLFKGWKTSTGSEYNFEKEVTSELKLYAIWEAKKYTINVDGDEKEVAYGDKFTLPTTKESSDNTKVFDDFVDEDGNHYPGGAEVEVDGPKTFTPTFKEKNKIYVRYFDGATELTDLKEEVYEGFKATEKTLSDKEHYLFKGWNTSSGSIYSFGAAVTSEVKLYAVWEAKKYTINVDGVESEKAYGSKFNLPTTKASTDNTKVFKDYVDDKGNHYAGGKEVTVDGPMTFTAQFREKDKFAVRYFDGATELTSLKELVYDGFNATQKTLSDKEHYLFKGWKTSSGSTYSYTTKVTSEVKLYAIWETKEYSIKIDGVESKKAYGSKFNLPTTKASTDKSKEFVDFVDDKGNHYAGGKEVTVDGPKTFTAQFKDKDKFAVRYFDGTTELTSLKEEVYEGEKAVRPAVNPTKPHYTFDKWRLSDNSVFNFDTKITGEVKLYASWILDTYKVTVDGSAQYIGYNNTFTLPYAPSVQRSKKFLGYKRVENGVVYPARNSFTVVGEMTFTSEIADRTLYTVKFYNNSTEYTSYRKSEYEGYAISAPTSPTEYKKQFQYWADKYGNRYSFGNGLTSNVDLYAVWKNIYTFRVDYNNATAYSNSTHYSTECIEGNTVTITLPTLKSDFTNYNKGKKGSYMFWGYAVNDNSNPKSATYRGGQTISIRMDKDITIYGVWRIDNYAGKALSLSYNGVTYKAGKGGQAKKISRISVQHGSGNTQVYKIPDANDKAKKAAGKTFKGWARSSTATTPDFKEGDLYICSGANDGNTLYAVWR